MIYNRISRCLDIIGGIETGAKNSLEGLQLACISKLVLYCGLMQNEIVCIQVTDIISKNGILAESISRFDKTIFLNNEAVLAVQYYFGEMNAKNHLLSRRNSPLFPSYRNVEKLKRHWSKADISYSEIREAGYFYYYANARNQGVPDTVIYEKGAKQLRVTPRQMRAVITGKKIMPGKTKRDVELLELLKKSEENGYRRSDTKTDDTPKSDTLQSNPPKSLVDFIKQTK